MSERKPNSHHLREVLLFRFNKKKFADWLRLTGLSQILMVKQLLVTEWFHRFKDGDFAVEDRHSGGGEKVVEDAELEASDS
nr:Mariner Mos1 transposase [Hymenolepis microstoma]